LKDFPPKLVKSIQKHYGGYKNAKIELGIEVKGEYSKPEAAIKANNKYSEDILANELRKAVEEYKTLGEIYEHKGRVISAICKIRPLKEFAEKHYIKLPKKRNHKVWTNNKIRKKMAEVVDKEGTTAM